MHMPIYYMYMYMYLFAGIGIIFDWGIFMMVSYTRYMYMYVCTLWICDILQLGKGGELVSYTLHPILPLILWLYFSYSIVSKLLYQCNYSIRTEIANKTPFDPYLLAAHLSLVVTILYNLNNITVR